MRTSSLPRQCKQATNQIFKIFKNNRLVWVFVLRQTEIAQVMEVDSRHKRSTSHWSKIQKC